MLKSSDSSFIREEQQLDWVANIVHVTKKNEKIWICINFYDLNAACPKDEFPLSITDVMIDNTCDFERMSFMDRFLGCNQIKMYPKDEKHTSIGGVLLHSDALRLEERRGNISTSNEYNLSWAYKQDRSTRRWYSSKKPYQRLSHYKLRRVFNVMWEHQLKMNPIKSFLGVAVANSLGSL